MKKNLLFLVMFASGVLTSLQAENSAPQDPQIVLPRRLSFVKEFKYPPKAANPNASDEEKKRAAFEAEMFPIVDKIELARDGDVSREIQHFANGSQAERWKSGDFSFIVNSTNPDVILVLAKGMSYDENMLRSFSRSDFDELKWVDRSTFQGEEVRQGLKCFVYKSGAMTAWLDQSTHLPIFFQSPQMQVAYTYKAAEALSLPDKLAQKMEQTRRAWAGVRATRPN